MKFYNNYIIFTYLPKMWICLCFVWKEQFLSLLLIMLRHVVVCCSYHKKGWCPLLTINNLMNFLKVFWDKRILFLHGSCHFSFQKLMQRQRRKFNLKCITLCFIVTWGLGGSVVQCSTCDLKIASLILPHGSFLVRGVVLSLTLAELYGL